MPPRARDLPAGVFVQCGGSARNPRWFLAFFRDQRFLHNAFGLPFRTYTVGDPRGIRALFGGCVSSTVCFGVGFGGILPAVSYVHCGGPAGDPRGIRWGSAGDPRPFRGIRVLSGVFWRGFWGDPSATTFPFYKINRRNRLQCPLFPGYL